MHLKRIIALLMIVVMIFSVLSGCQKEKEEPVTLVVYSQLANFSGELTGWFAKEMLDRFNVKMIIVPDAEGIYDTRMETGNLGDIVIWGGDGDDYLRAVKAGLLFDWEEEDLLGEFGPYIKEHMPYALEKNKSISDGKLYGFGHNVATSSEDHEAFFYTWDLRWDLYKQLGYPEVKNLDDYVDMLEDMKAICPTDDNGNPTYAVSLWPDWDGSMVMYVKAMATAYYGYDELGIGLYDPETGIYYDALAEGSPYLKTLKFFNKLYQKGLLDPDSMTQTFDEMSAKVLNGGTFFSIFNYAGSIPYNTDAHIEQNKMMLSLVPSEAEPIAYGMNVKGGNRIWSIGSKTQYPELCMEILNWFCTPEGRMICEYGPKGLLWDYDEEKNTYGTELGKSMHNDKKNIMFPKDSGYIGNFNDGSFQLNNTTWSINAKNPDSNGETYNWDFWKSNLVEPRCETEADWRAFTGVSTVQEYMDSRPYSLAPGTSYSESGKSDELKVRWEQVIKCITDYSWKAIYAKVDPEFDKIVEIMIKNANEYGYKECLEWSLGEAARRKALEDEVK